MQINILVCLQGDLAQLVERLNGIQKVRGSTPLISTEFELYKKEVNLF